MRISKDSRGSELDNWTELVRDSEKLLQLYIYYCHCILYYDIYDPLMSHVYKAAEQTTDSTGMLMTAQNKRSQNKNGKKDQLVSEETVYSTLRLEKQSNESDPNVENESGVEQWWY